MVLETVRALLQFTTILPVGKVPADFTLLTRHSYLYPLAGYLIGGTTAGICLLVQDPGIAAAVAVALLLLITGANHFDGLLDLGDGVMAHGDRERRVRALTDRYLGTGGVAMGAAVLLITFSSLQALHPFAAALLTAEVGGQFAMVMLTCYGKPFHEGLHSRFYHDAKPFFPLAALALCLPLILLPLTPIQLGAAFSLMIATPLVLNAISNRLFGGVNGDVTGASHEITRAIILAAIALI